jgi:uncharacterized membrane protein
VDVGKSRVEAFSDGVIAIIITIMVLEMRAPHGVTLADLVPLAAVFGSYVLSFVHVGIYWNNHHHMLHAARHVSGAVLWCNLHLLFWLSLVPFVTAWMGENHFAPMPVALYGSVMFMSGIAYYLLTRSLIARHGEESAFTRALGSDVKGKVSVLVYGVAIALAFVNQWVAVALYAAVAAWWLIPDRRFERAVVAEPL